MPLFSIIIPSFNRAAMIGETLESVVAQRCTDYETIVIDDGSTDETLGVLATYGDRIRVLRQANAGAGAARNLGIAQARGDYVVFLDSDDVWFPWTLQTYKRVIEQANRPSIVMGAAFYWRGDTALRSVSETPLLVHAFDDYFATASDRFVRTACVLAVKRERLQDVGGFTTARINGEDYDLLYRMGDAPGFVRILAPPIVAYRQHAQSSVSDPRRSFEGTVYQLEREYSGDYPGGPTRRDERRAMILFGARNVSWMLLERGRPRDACALYIRTFRQNLTEGRVRYIIGFPVLAAAASVGLYRSSRAREEASFAAATEVRSSSFGASSRPSPGISNPSERPLRILMTIHHSLDWNAGAAGSTLQLKRCYEEAGHRVEIISTDDVRVAKSEIGRQIAFPWTVARHLADRAEGVDVIDASTGDAWAWASLLRTKTGRPALVTRSTGLEHISHLARIESARAGHERLSWKYPIYHGGARLFEVALSLRLSDLCMFLNTDDQKYAIEKLRVDSQRTMLVANGVPPALLGLPIDFCENENEPLRIACIGSFIERKGIDYLVPALHEILNARADVRVSFIGAGVPEATVLSRFDPALHGRVQVVPQYQHADFASLMRGHHIQIMASLTEGFGKTLIEGMCCGVATITTDVSFTRSVIRDGENGLVVPIRNAGAIASRASRVIEDRDLRRQLRRNAYVTAQQYSWRAAAQGRLDGYRRAIAMRAPQRLVPR